ncbi:MAG: hypothetical protein K8F91_11545, partial [Candidatus Obscuribacterales bacterium]|nr:hypothetical protein [Candidatus Obscuribacterales bacterium]
MAHLLCGPQDYALMVRLPISTYPLEHGFLRIKFDTLESFLETRQYLPSWLFLVYPFSSAMLFAGSEPIAYIRSNQLMFAANRHRQH